MQVRYVYAFCFFSPLSASIRYRILHVLAELEITHGIKYSIVHPGYSFKNMLHFLKTYLSALLFREKNSVIIFQKIHADNLYVKALKFLARAQKKNTLYDTDDADYLRFPTENIHFFMRTCADCAVGSEHLQNYVRQYNKNVAMITSPVLTHNKLKQELNDTLTIGWVGEYNSNGGDIPDYSHVVSLNTLVFPAVKKLGFRCDLVLLGVVNQESAEAIRQYFASNPNIRVITPQNIDWLDENNTYEQISRFDIGVSPLTDHEFNHAKSAFKLKQYLSAGVPVLASPIGENKTFLEEGKNGFPCSTSEDFYQNILRIKSLNKEDYFAMSDHAKNSFEKFSVKKYCEDFLAYYAAK